MHHGTRSSAQGSDFCPTPEQPPRSDTRKRIPTGAKSINKSTATAMLQPMTAPMLFPSPPFCRVKRHDSVSWYVKVCIPSHTLRFTRLWESACPHPCSSHPCNSFPAHHRYHHKPYFAIRCRKPLQSVMQSERLDLRPNPKTAPPAAVL